MADRELTMPRKLTAAGAGGQRRERSSFNKCTVGANGTERVYIGSSSRPDAA
jgi:hypothetical protein